MTQCGACNNLYGAICDEKSYRLAILSTLCTLLESITNSSFVLPTTAVLDQEVRTASEIEADYATFESVGLINSTKKLNHIRVVNQTDADLEFSYNGGTTVAFTVLSNSEYREDLNMILASITALRMKKVDGQTAGFGRVLIEGRYNAL